MLTGGRRLDSLVHMRQRNTGLSPLDQHIRLRCDVTCPYATRFMVESNSP